MLKISPEASFYIPYERCKIKNPEDDVAGIGMDYCTSCQVITITIPIELQCSECSINCFYKKYLKPHFLVH